MALVNIHAKLTVAPASTSQCPHWLCGNICPVVTTGTGSTGAVAHLDALGVCQVGSTSWALSGPPVSARLFAWMGLATCMASTL